MQRISTVGSFSKSNRAEPRRYMLIEQNLGQALAVIRLGQGLTQKQLADALSEAMGSSIRQGYISRVERGLKQPSPTRLGLLLDCLGSTLADLDKALTAVGDVSKLTPGQRLAQLKHLSSGRSG